MPVVEPPPPPVWMRSRRGRRSHSHPVLETQPGESKEARQKRLFRRVSNVTAGIVVSAIIHLTILLALNLWWFFLRPGPSGFVINCEILTEDLGAAGEEQSVVNAPLPDEPPPGEDDVKPSSPGHGPGEGENRALGSVRGRGEGAGAGGVGFFGTKGEGHSFVFIVDRSGSMKNGRLALAKEELSRAIGQLSPKQQFYVIFYNDSPHRMVCRDAQEGLVPATAANRDAVRKWFESINARGGTKPAESIELALAMQPDVIFFLTDGEIPEETEHIARMNNFHGTVIHTTALVSTQGEAILRAIAADSHGTYRHIDDPSLKALQKALAHTRKQRIATAKLKLARKHLEDNRPRSARKWLEEIVTEYPNTPQAEEARKVLDTL